MRQIRISAALIGSSMLIVSLVVAVMTTRLFFQFADGGALRGVGMIVSAAMVFLACTIFLYRLFFYFFPIQEGELPEGSRAELIYNVYQILTVLLLGSLISTRSIPTAPKRLVYLALGTRMGKNSYCAGAIIDPLLTTIGEKSIIGQNAALFAHAIEGNYLAVNRIVIGNQVTIGAHSVIMSDVHIGDGAKVAAGAVVRKGTRIGPGEVWGGVPARRLKPAGQQSGGPETETIAGGTGSLSQNDKPVEGRHTRA